MIVRELLTKIGYKVDNAPLERSEQLVTRFKQALAGLGIGLAVRAINGMVNSAASLQAQMGDMATELDVSKQFIREYGWAARQSGTDIQYVAKSMDFLKRNASAARSGDALAIQKFKELGITLDDLRGPLQDNERLFEATGLRLAGMTDSQQRARLQMELMGGTAKKLQGLFARGAGGLAGLRQAAQAVVISEEESDRLAEFDNMVQVTKMSLQSMADRISIALLPAFKAFHGFLQDASREGGAFRRVVDGMSRGMEYLKRNADKVALVFGVLFGTATVAGIGMVTVKVFGLVRSLNAARLAVLALQGSALLIPIAIGAAVVALFFLWDELSNFEKGNDTLIGRALNKWREYEDAIMAGVNALRTARDLVTDPIGVLDTAADFYGFKKTEGVRGAVNREVSGFLSMFSPQGLMNGWKRFNFLSGALLPGMVPQGGEHGYQKYTPRLPGSYYTQKPSIVDNSRTEVTVNVPPGAAGSPQEIGEEVRKVYREERSRERLQDQKALEASE